jgi:hypothetical protein
MVCGVVLPVQLLGLDYLVDSNSHPWLLEVNGTPSLAVAHHDAAVEQLIQDAKVRKVYSAEVVAPDSTVRAGFLAAGGSACLTRVAFDENVSVDGGAAQRQLIVNHNSHACVDSASPSQR